MIDSEGYRLNVGIILTNDRSQVLWARRVGQRAWQFPQGGIKPDETPTRAMYRELYEELGLVHERVNIIGSTKDWLRYKLPKRFVRRKFKPICIGQKQIWFLLQLLGKDSDVCLDCSERPEFDYWKWVNYWHPSREVISFKREVYRLALRELAPLLYGRNF